MPGVLAMQWGQYGGVLQTAAYSRSLQIGTRGKYFVTINSSRTRYTSSNMIIWVPDYHITVLCDGHWVGGSVSPSFTDALQYAKRQIQWDRREGQKLRITQAATMQIAPTRNLRRIRLKS